MVGPTHAHFAHFTFPLTLYNGGHHCCFCPAFALFSAALNITLLLLLRLCNETLILGVRWCFAQQGFTEWSACWWFCLESCEHVQFVPITFSDNLSQVVKATENMDYPDARESDESDMLYSKFLPPFSILNLSNHK